MVDSKGSRKGIIVDLDKAVQSIHKAVEEAEKLAEAGVNWNLAPVADVNVPANPVIGTRAYRLNREDQKQSAAPWGRRVRNAAR